MKRELADLICNLHSCRSKLLVEKELGNYAPTIWQVKLAAEEIRLNETNKTFQFKNAEFSFDVNLEEPHKTRMNYITTIPVSGKGTYTFSDKNQDLRILDLVLDTF
ncbi:hypothetical protein [Leeuwenhoekiella marinoflava]|uniref:hypothetical protein n=1 Tax=Leeuwenhoekiella marinoflava TaxID=988 RepID=UPI003003A442